MLPSRSAFSNPTSNGVLSSKHVSPEQLLKTAQRAAAAQRRAQREQRKQRRADQRRKAQAAAKSKMAPGSRAFSNLPEPHELTPNQVNARLSTLDEKLQAEQKRRMELEGMLRQVTRGNGHRGGGGGGAEGAAASTSMTTSFSAESSPLRISSPGIPLRRGSQVGTARGGPPSGGGDSRSSPNRGGSSPIKGGKNYKRYYRHARSMEDDMIKTEEELSVCKQELKMTAEALITVQGDLKQRTEELDASRVKVDALLRMVKHVLMHLVEKKEARRFSMQASQELQRRIAEPLNESFGAAGDSRMSEYVNERLNAISEILPRWSDVHGDDEDGQYDDLASTDNDDDDDDDDDDGASLLSEMDSLASNFDPDEMPPPLPQAATVSRRGGEKGRVAMSNAANVPLPGSPGSASPAQTPAPVPPGKALEEALLDIWDVVDPDEDGVLSFRELRDNLLDAMPTAPTDLHASVMAALKEGAFLMHDNGAAAYRENDFVQALATKPFIQELLICAVRDGALMDIPEGVGGGGSLEGRLSLGEALSKREAKQEAQRLSEWKRRQSTHLMPRGIHGHGKKGLPGV
jgi:hypothetical protein